MLDELGPASSSSASSSPPIRRSSPPDIVVELRSCRTTPRRRLRGHQPGPGRGARRAPDRSSTSFDAEPIASASIGQVPPGHAPERRPGRGQGAAAGAEATVEADIALFYQVARLLKRYVRRLDFIEHRRARGRVRALHPGRAGLPGEARNARLLRSAFDGHEGVVIPRVYWTYSTQRRAHPRYVPGPDPEGRHGSASPRRAPGPGVPDRRGLDGDDLRARAVPRRPAPGQHPGPRGRPPRARRLRHHRAPLDRGHAAGHAPVHRRRLGNLDQMPRRLCRPGRAHPDRPWPTTCAPTSRPCRRARRHGARRPGPGGAAASRSSA